MEPTQHLPALSCQHHSHLFKSPLCSKLTTQQKVGNVFFHIFTFALPLLIYKIYAAIKRSRIKPQNPIAHLSLPENLERHSITSVKSENNPRRSQTSLKIETSSHRSEVSEQQEEASSSSRSNTASRKSTLDASLPDLGSSQAPQEMMDKDISESPTISQEDPHYPSILLSYQGSKILNEVHQEIQSMGIYPSQYRLELFSKSSESLQKLNYLYFETMKEFMGLLKDSQAWNNKEVQEKFNKFLKIGFALIYHCIAEVKNTTVEERKKMLLEPIKEYEEFYTNAKNCNFLYNDQITNNQVSKDWKNSFYTEGTYQNTWRKVFNEICELAENEIGLVPLSQFYPELVSSIKRDQLSTY